MVLYSFSFLLKLFTVFIYDFSLFFRNLCVSCYFYFVSACMISLRGPPSGPKFHAFTQIFFAIHAFTQIFLGIHANPIFREIGKIFGKIGEIFENRGKRENSCIHAKNRAYSRIHAIKKWIFTFTLVFFNSRIHAIFFFNFHAFTQPKKPIHVFTQTALGAPYNAH